MTTVNSQEILVKLKHQFGGAHAFKLDIDLRLPYSGTTVVYGDSGSGKTTLLRCLAGLQKVDTGHIRMLNEVWQSSTTFVPTHKRSIGYVFQEASLFSFMTARENLALALSQSGSQENSKRLAEILELLNLDSQLDSMPPQLSGGERQRVAIARALLLEPDILLFDEPLASLDSSRKQEIYPYLAKLQRESEIPIIYVTHSSEEVIQLADHLIILEEGRCSAQGTLSELMPVLNFPATVDDQSTIIATVVADKFDECHLVRVRFAGGEFLLADEDLKKGEKLRVRIKAGDISIALSNHDDSSIVNRLEAEVIEIKNIEALDSVLVKLLIGETELLAKISRYSAQKLKIELGKRVWAQFKAVAVVR